MTTPTPAGCGPRYEVRMHARQAHRFDVALELDAPSPEGQEFWLPVWIPGSYLVREFARHVLDVQAACEDRNVPVRKVAKNRWRVAPCPGPLRLRWSVFAHDASVRTAWLDDARAFFNPSSLLLAAAGHEHRTHEVHLHAPDDRPAWTVGTTMPAREIDARGFGLYCADTYDRLVDHPVLAGTLLRVNLRAHGTPHEMIIDHAEMLEGEIDTPRLRADLQRICETEIAMFEPRAKLAPFARYAFLVMPVASGYGGLEHADSTALVCSEASLPHPRDAERHADYRQFLGLCSHEYFHAWNVKRIRPQALTPYDLERENLTGLLWLFEGFTSYYDDLVLRRAGLVTPQQYLDLLARAIDGVRAAPGRMVQSLEEASFDAWIKFYRPDENTANSTVSYYTLGALFALTLDLTLRQRGQACLDDVMRLLWRRYGREDAPLRAQGVPEDALPDLVREATGVDLRRLFTRHVAGRAELPLKRLLAAFGVQWTHGDSDPMARLGLRADEQQGWLLIRQIQADGWARAAGLTAGDLIVALEGRRATPELFKRLGARARPGDIWHLHVMRDARLITCEAPLPAPVAGPVRLAPAASPDADARKRRSNWLGV